MEITMIRRPAYKIAKSTITDAEVRRARAIVESHGTSVLGVLVAAQVRAIEAGSPPERLIGRALVIRNERPHGDLLAACALLVRHRAEYAAKLAADDAIRGIYGDERLVSLVRHPDMAHDIELGARPGPRPSTIERDVVRRAIWWVENAAEVRAGGCSPRDVAEALLDSMTIPMVWSYATNRLVAALHQFVMDGDPDILQAHWAPFCDCPRRQELLGQWADMFNALFTWARTGKECHAWDLYRVLRDLEVYEHPSPDIRACMLRAGRAPDMVLASMGYHQAIADRVSFARSVVDGEKNPEHLPVLRR